MIGCRPSFIRQTWRFEERRPVFPVNSLLWSRDLVVCWKWPSLTTQGFLFYGCSLPPSLLFLLSFSQPTLTHIFFKLLFIFYLSHINYMKRFHWDNSTQAYSVPWKIHLFYYIPLSLSLFLPLSVFAGFHYAVFISIYVAYVHPLPL
jgi:hypothetical protein